MDRIMRIFSEIGGATLEVPEVNANEHGCQYISKNILNA